MTVETRERTERNMPKLANQIVVLLLHSPLHRLISKNRSAAERFMLLRIHLEQLATSAQS